MPVNSNEQSDDEARKTQQDSIATEMAADAGNLHRTWLKTFRRMASEAKADPYKYMIFQVEKMHEDGLLPVLDRRILLEVVGVVMGKQQAGNPLQELRRLRSELLENQTCSALAIAIAGVALDSLEAALERGSMVPGVLFSKSGAADLAGALTGGNIGSKGGLLGLVIGAVAAGVTASLLIADDEEDDDDDDDVLLFEDIIVTPV